jgi:hypothetical protein
LFLREPSQGTPTSTHEFPPCKEKNAKISLALLFSRTQIPEIEELGTAAVYR